MLFSGLGVWQVQRLGWKTELIRQIESRVDAAPTPAPGPDGWAGVTQADDQYRAVVVTGRFDHDRETRVQAATALGGGFWILTPLETADGWTVLVNRGFTPTGSEDWSRPEGVVRIEGLLRVTEPHGAFLRENDPAGDRWRSRDVTAITQARGLPQGSTAPYFIDERDLTAGERWPRPGLTVLRFSNNHLMYALTWFGLAGLSVFGAVMVVRKGARR